VVPDEYKIQSGAFGSGTSYALIFGDRRALTWDAERQSFAARLLTNAPVTVRDVLPGAVAAAIVLEASFQIVPIFVRLADVNPTLRVLGGPILLLIWLYVMANVIVWGAELNWWNAERRALRERTPADALA